MKHPSGLPPILWFFMAATVALAGISLTYTLICGYLLHLSYPYGFPLFGGLPAFTDFTDFSERYSRFGTERFWQADVPLVYPAPLLAVLGLLFSTPYPFAIYISLYLLTILAGGLLLTRALVARNCSIRLSILFSAIFILTSWPAFFLLSRANIEGVDAFFLAAGVLAMLRGRSYLGAASIGIAGSMKYYPILLMAVLLSKRQCKQIAFGLFAAILTILLSALYIDPSLTDAAQSLTKGLVFFKQAYSEKLQWPDYDHSMFALYKVIYGAVHKGDLQYQPDFPIAQKIYLGLAALCGLAIYFYRIRELPIINQVIALSVCCVLLPPVSYDYTLVNLLLPCGLLIIYTAEVWKHDRQVGGLKPVFFCFAVIFTWGTFLTLDAIRIAGQVRAVALIGLLITVLRYPFLPITDTHSCRKTIS